MSAHATLDSPYVELDPETDEDGGGADSGGGDNDHSSDSGVCHSMNLRLLEIAR